MHLKSQGHDHSEHGQSTGAAEFEGVHDGKGKNREKRSRPASHIAVHSDHSDHSDHAAEFEEAHDGKGKNRERKIVAPHLTSDLFCCVIRSAIPTFTTDHDHSGHAEHSDHSDHSDHAAEFEEAHDGKGKNRERKIIAPHLTSVLFRLCHAFCQSFATDHDHSGHAGHSDHSDHMRSEQETSSRLPWWEVIVASLVINLATLSGVVLIVSTAIYRGMLKLKGRDVAAGDIEQSSFVEISM